MSIRRVFVVAAFLACVIGPPAAAQVSDTSLTALAGRLLRAEFRGGGWRDTLSWQPTDSASAYFLQRVTFAPSDNVRALGAGRLECPGSTDSTGGLFKQPVGYSVQAFMRRWTGDSVMVALSVSCRFTYHGRANGFVEAASWEIVRTGKVWLVKRLLDRSIT